MAHSSDLVHLALADVFLTSIPSSERNFAVRNLAANVDSKTLGLVAALVQQHPDEEANTHLNTFLIRSIENRDAASAATLCVHYPQIRDALLQRAERELYVCFSQLLCRPKNDGFVVPVDRILAVDPTEDYDPQDGIDHQVEDLVDSIVLYLDFIKYLFRCPIDDGSFVVSSPIVCAIFGLLASSSADVAAAARDTAFAFLAAFKSGAFTFSHHKSDPDELDRHLWRCIQNMLRYAQQSSYRTTAYAIWLRWLDLPSYGQSRQYAIQKDEYWKFLLGTLGQVSQGDTEQRKACLHILRRSLAVVRNNVRANDMELTLDEEDRPSRTGSRLAQAQYGRFCTVYETIVIGRYLNQALECVKDLDAFASSETIVQKSWLFALLESSLSPVTQDSMRKMLGNWLMSTDIKLSNHAEEFSQLLQNSFLPWATLGPLFTGSVQGKTKNMQCGHGIRLASFFERLLQSHLGQDDIYSRKCIVNAVLTFLDVHKNRLVPCAVLFLLNGLASGLKGEQTRCMENEELGLIVNLSRTVGFPEIAKDALSIQCHELTKLVDHETEPAADIADLKLESLSKRVQELRLDAPSRFDHALTESSRWQTLDQFLQDLDNTRYACVQGNGLQIASESLTSILDDAEAQNTNAQHLQRALDTVWDELERQDYPKDVMIYLPRLMLHPVCVACCLENESLGNFILDIFEKLRVFVKGRIYLWSPLMKAFRIALIRCPAAAEKFALDDFIVQVANNPPFSKVEFKLEATAVQLLSNNGEITRSYADYYGEAEETGYAAFFDLLNRIGDIDSSMTASVYARLLEPWTSQKPPVPIVTKWKTTLQLQILLLLSEQQLTNISVEKAQDQLRILLKIAAMEPLPRYRFLLEWMISRIIIQHPAAGETILEALSTTDHHSNPKYLGSLTKIAVMLACLDSCPPGFAARVAYRLIALSSSSKIIIRHEAQWSFPILWSYAENKGWTEITSNPACAALNDYIRSLERFSEPPAARELERLDPDIDHSLATLLQGRYLQLEPRGEEVVTAEDFQDLWDQDRDNKYLPKTLPNARVPLGTPPDASTKPSDTLPDQASQQELKQSARTEAFAALQTKGKAYLATETVDTEEERTRTTDLIVVGSLVDNAYNLGGLSRISEIFGASALYMQSPNGVLANKDFISVAVASQNHLPIRDLQVENLVTFLTEKKTQGYTVVGVEQTDRSVILGDVDTKLPEKTLLIMGAEKEGIPALVLGECDMLVEVPQRGVTRSMNVQTAAGVVLYEYSRQHRDK